MPFFQKIECGNAWGGIWQITESFDELCDRLPDGAGHKAYAMRRFAAERRKLEYAAVRMLIYVLTGKDKTVDYLLSGHPFFSDGSMRISISHTPGYAAVLLSRIEEVGIDIEAYSGRVLRLKDRLIGADEKADSLYEILLHWSAKETAFKILDEQGIDFRTHLQVKGMNCPANEIRPESGGDFSLSYHLSDGKAGVFHIHYRTTADFVLTYALH